MSTTAIATLSTTVAPASASASTSTAASAPVKSAPQHADVKPPRLTEGEITTVAQACAATMLDTYVREGVDTRERNFLRAQAAYAAVQSGATDEAVAREITLAYALTFKAPAGTPRDKVREETARAQEIARQTSVSAGGASVTRVAITHRRNAWADVLAAGVKPTTATVNAAYVLTQAGFKGLGAMRKTLCADTHARPEKERAAFYLAESVSRFQALKQALASDKVGAEISSAKKATASSQKKAEPVEAEPVELDSLAEIAAYLKATISRPWSDDDKAELAALFAQAAEALAS